MQFAEMHSTELKPGDVVRYADLEDTVISVEMPKEAGCVVMRVNVIRRGQPTFWYCGVASKQSVHRQAA